MRHLTENESELRRVARNERLSLLGLVVCVVVLGAGGIALDYSLRKRIVKDAILEVEDDRPRATMQRCEMCGADWEVTPLDSTKSIPRSVKWCFHDGAICNIGLAMLVESSKGETDESKRAWLNHCLTCGGCRRATFSPNEWASMVDAIKKAKR